MWYVQGWCEIRLNKYKCKGRGVCSFMCWQVQGLYSLSGKTSYRQISWSLEAARLGVIMIVSLWNLTGISAALLPRCLLNFRAIGKVQTRISRLRDFTRSYGKTSYRLVNRGPGAVERMSIRFLGSMGYRMFAYVLWLNQVPILLTIFLS